MCTALRNGGDAGARTSCTTRISHLIGDIITCCRRVFRIYRTWSAMHPICAWMAYLQSICWGWRSEGLFTTNQLTLPSIGDHDELQYPYSSITTDAANDWEIYGSFPSSLATGVFPDRFIDAPVHSDKVFGPSQRVMILQQMLRNNLTASSGCTSETATSMVIWLNH